MDVKKINHWGESARARDQKMLPSSSTTPTEEGLVSSETLTVMTLPVRSPQNVESKDSVTESDIDTEEEECESENDLEILGEQSDTVD